MYKIKFVLGIKKQTASKVLIFLHQHIHQIEGLSFI